MTTKFKSAARAATIAALAGMQISCSDAGSGVTDETFDAQTAAVWRQSKLAKVSGDGQTAVVESALRDSLVVRITDKKGSVAGKTVQWVVRSGGGFVSPAQSITDSRGYARTAWTMGSVAGGATLDATVPDVGAVTFSATATAKTGGTEPVSTPLDSAAFYVATNGSDSNAGTIGAPWRLIGTALTRLRAGQTLYVRAGTYVENIRNPVIQPGRADARIRVAAYPGERPVIQGLLWLNRPSYWTIDGINVTWSTANRAEDHMVKMTNGVGWVFENAELWGARSFAGLLVYGSMSGEPANWVIRGNCVRDTWTSPTHHINGDHNLYINTGTTAGPGLIERNILFNAPNGQNIKLGFGRSDPQPGDGTANVTVRFNTMYKSLKNLMVADESHGNIIEHNIIMSSQEGYAIRSYRLSGTGNVFRSNVFNDFRYLQYGDSGYGVVTDGGGNLFPHDPQFDDVTSCTGFKPLNTTVQSYGRYAR